VVKWTLVTGEKLVWAPEIGDMLAYMFHMPQAQRLTCIAEIAAHVMDCPRCCIILEKDSEVRKRKKLIIAAGFPDYGHGIGEEIQPQFGKKFLEDIMRRGVPVHIKDPLNDPRVAYMKSLIKYFGIKSQLFVPLYYKKVRGEYEISPFGIMTFDSTDKDQESFNKAASEVNKIVKVVVALILSEQRRTSNDYELMRTACINALGQHSLGIEDALGNLILKLPMSIKRLTGVMHELKEKLPEDAKVDEAAEYVSIINEAIEQFASKAKDVLSTIRLNPSKLSIREHNLKTFLEDLVGKFIEEKTEGKIDVSIKLDLKNLCKRTVMFDYEKMRECLAMILDNSIKAEAKNISIKAVCRERKKDQNDAIIAITRDGKRFGSLMAKQIFMLFAAGGGLSVAKSIIEAHNGKIDIKEDRKTTKFIINLPTK
jgi:signal transduction histidine kinase